MFYNFETLGSSVKQRGHKPPNRCSNVYSHENRSRLIKQSHMNLAKMKKTVYNEATTSVFSVFISTPAKRMFRTGGALVGNTVHLVCRE